MSPLKPLMKLVEKRENKGFTQVKLAETAEISRSLLANIERGYANPSLSVAYRISRALGTTVDDIFFERDVH